LQARLAGRLLADADRQSMPDHGQRALPQMRLRPHLCGLLPRRRAAKPNTRGAPDRRHAPTQGLRAIRARRIKPELSCLASGSLPLHAARMRASEGLSGRPYRRALSAAELDTLRLALHGAQQRHGGQRHAVDRRADRDGRRGTGIKSTVSAGWCLNRAGAASESPLI
jgi:hypothetical protein